MRASTRALAASGAALLFAGAAGAADLGVAGRKLIVIDKLAAAGKAKVVFVSKGDPGIQKGPGGDPADLDGSFEVFYTDAPANFARLRLNEAGAWRVNEDDKASYRGARVDRLLLTTGKRFRISTTVLATASAMPNTMPAAWLQPNARAIAQPATVATALCATAPGTAIRQTRSSSCG